MQRATNHQRRNRPTAIRSAPRHILMARRSLACRRDTGHNWLSANGRYSFVCVESRTLGEAGVAVIDHKTGAYVTTYVYSDPGSARPRPHGIFYEPAKLSQ